MLQVNKIQMDILVIPEFAIKCGVTAEAHREDASQALIEFQ